MKKLLLLLAVAFFACNNTSEEDDGDRAVVYPRGCDTTGIRTAFLLQYPKGADSATMQEFVNQWCR